MTRDETPYHLSGDVGVVFQSEVLPGQGNSAAAQEHQSFTNNRTVPRPLIVSYMMHD